MIARLLTAFLFCILCCDIVFAAERSGSEGAPATDPANIAATVIPALPALPEMALHGILPVLTYRGGDAHLIRNRVAHALSALPDAPSSISTLVDQLPVAGRVYRRAGQRFNTSDGSSVDAFAICYRMTHRIGMQVIPGDPAPVKLAVSSLTNNTGVTVGMTLRLSH